MNDSKRCKMESNAITKNLIKRITDFNEDLVGLDIIVSFIRHSGFKEIKPLLDYAIAQQVPVRIITSTYMNITEPVALSKLLNLMGDKSIHMYNGQADSFHPKAYFFKCRSVENSHVYIGSSNISKPALTSGVEWNYRVLQQKDSTAYGDFQKKFEEIYQHDSYVLTEDHIRDYRRTLVVSDSERRNTRINLHYNYYRKESDGASQPIVELYQPKDAQAEALYELEKTREQGNDKALVVAATGIGKTYLAAFDSRKFNSVLFIAHREEILEQAVCTFSNIRGREEIGMYNQNHKDKDKSLLFASVQTLSRREHLNQFDPDQFDYIVIDEFHHASSISYRKIVEYFKPKFLLGLTATPHRMDKKDVFQICDYNVPYEVSLFNAINRDWLVPFQYYGIYDSTVQYENITFLQGKYMEKELTKALSIEKRADLIYRHYQKHQRQRTIGFCSSIDHAEYMTKCFIEKGINAVALHSDAYRAYVKERNIALDEFKKGEIQVIFSVDMLNEGVDLPDVDLILFLRPTESPTVFLQQLGRGLRHAPKKENLKVLDFIGNYKNVDLLPFWLSGKIVDSGREKKKLIKGLLEQDHLPSGCYIDFDLEVVDLFDEMSKAKVKIAELIDGLYDDCKLNLGHIPIRMEFFESLDDINYNNIKKSSKLNPFRNFLSYIDHKEQSYVPSGFFESNAMTYIRMIESTAMQALYKVPIFLAFYNGGKFKTKVEKEDIEASFFSFYQNPRHGKDLDRYKTRENFRTWTPEDFWRLAKNNPIHFLCKTHHELFEFEEETSIMRIKVDLEEWIHHPFFTQQVKDAMDFRRNQFLDVNLK